MEKSTATTTYRQPSTAIGLALYWAGEFEASRPLLEQAAQRGMARGEEWDRLGVLLALAQLEWDTGNWHLAEQHRHAIEEARGEYAESFLWLVNLDARFALDRGQLISAREIAESGLPEADRTESMQHASNLQTVLATVDLLSGRPDVAHCLLEEQREWLQNGYGPTGYRRSFVWSLDVEALIALGDLNTAEEVCTELGSRADLSDSPNIRALALRCEGLLVAARGDLLGAIEAMDRALAAHAVCPRPFEHGRTLLEKGSIERRAKRKAAAKQTLEEALAILEPLGAQFWVSRARDELSRIGLRRPKATAGLTSAQTRVAECVAAGLTNPEIARQLHMSLRTVESHLSRVFREYRVNSRSQLAALAASDRPSRLAASGERAVDDPLSAAS